jgi:predicted amidohydrolase
LKIAIAQMSMGWTPEENTRAIVDGLAEAKALAAEVALFPECATTGFHRRVPEHLSRGAVRRSLRRIRERCAALELAAVVGTPFFPSPRRAEVWNSAVVIGARGEVRAVCPKIGLTRSEAGFFEAGAARPTFTLGTVASGVILCREVRDAERIREQLPEVRLVFWPGAIAWRSETGDPENIVTEEIARACARALQCHLVQCNWASSLNRPELRGLGGSLVVSPGGEVLHRCPMDEAGITLVALDPRPISPPSRRL